MAKGVALSSCCFCLSGLVAGSTRTGRIGECNSPKKTRAREELGYSWHRDSTSTPPHTHTHTHTPPHTHLHTHTSTPPPHLVAVCVQCWMCECCFLAFPPPPPTKHRHAVWFAHNLLCLVAIRQLAPFWFLERAKLTLARALQVRLAFEAALMSHLREKKETKEIAPQSQICLWRKREKSKEKGKKKRRVQSQSSHKQGVSVR